jgi:hypothetical protein
MRMIASIFALSTVALVVSANAENGDAVPPHKGGPCYGNLDKAAIAMVDRINPTSIKQNREYASWLTLWGNENCWSYTTPRKGGRYESDAGPKPRNTLGQVHTHGAPEAATDEQFSPQDMIKADGMRITMYIGTPSGAVRQFVPCSVDWFEACGDGKTLGRVKTIRP